MTENNKGILLPNTDNHNCFACSSKNVHGLHMEFYVDSDAVCSWVEVPEHLCSWSNTVHGGIISTILDETMGWAGIYFLKKVALTKKMTVEFRKALFVGEELKVEASVVKTMGKREAAIAGKITNGKNELCADSEGIFTLVSADVARRLNVLSDEQVQTFFKPLVHFASGREQGE